jgi:HPt (histidine-containing phosphotransfer) domain-containing protein
VIKQSKLYDLDALSRDHKDDVQFVHYMVSLFLSVIPETKDLFIKAAETDNWNDVHFYAHKLKASIDIFDLGSLKQIIRSIETRSKRIAASDKIQLKQDVQLVADYLEKCVSEMKAEFDQQQH